MPWVISGRHRVARVRNMGFKSVPAPTRPHRAHGSLSFSLASLPTGVTQCERKPVGTVPSRIYHADVAVRLEAVRFDVADAAAVAAFWSGLLHREATVETGGGAGVG